ncbi:MAG: hypothetical protein K6E51_03225, partial [Treponema sp.]|nr:hypothetical protein [Treponema sp.]
MSEFGKIDSSSDAWYACSGECDDVVVSTRIRLARNLANFPFPDRCSAAVVEQIQSIVFDSFTRIPDAEKYNVFSIQNLEESGMNVLKERGFISPPYGTGLVLRSDSKGYCVINSRDHIRLAGISAGLAAESAFAMCHTMDENLQQVMQFAASYDFGFLTASLGDVGSGMKASLRVHLPSILYMDRLQNLAAEIERRGFAIKATFALDSKSKGALGDFYDVCSLSAFDGNELDQLIALTSIGKYIVEQERLCRQEGLESKPTRLHDIVYRAYALIKYSRFISLQ